MKVPVVMPRIGSEETEYRITQWHKRIGERVFKGEPLCQVECGKATFDVESEYEGTLSAILVEADQVVEAGAKTAEIEVAGD